MLPRDFTPAHLLGGFGPGGVTFCPYPIRGYVIAVYEPGSSTDPDRENAYEGVLCDVEVIEPGWAGVLRRVPVMVASGGVWDREHWRPRPATIKIGGGALKQEDGPSTTPLHEQDGDFVVVQFLGGDIQAPAIVGQLPHPKTLRKRQDATDYRLLRYLAGVGFGVKNDGSVEVDLTGATDGTVQQDGSEAPAQALSLTVKLADGSIVVEKDGKTTVTLANGATVETKGGDVFVTDGNVEVRAAVGAPTFQAVLDPLLTDLQILVAEWFPVVQVIAGIFGMALPNTPTIVAQWAMGKSMAGQPLKSPRLKAGE